MVPVVSTAWAASKVLLSGPGRFFNAACTVATAQTGYLILLDATSAPADTSDVTGGASGRYLGCLPFTTSGPNETVNLDAEVMGHESDSGIRCDVGCVVLLSSTAPTSVTGVASGLWVNGSVG